MGLGIVRFNEKYDQIYRRDVEEWTITDGNWGVLFGTTSKQDKIVIETKPEWVKVDPQDGKCAFCGFEMARMWQYDGNFYCQNCHDEWSE
jgi:hypothetical protein